MEWTTLKSGNNLRKKPGIRGGASLSTWKSFSKISGFRAGVVVAKQYSIVTFEVLHHLGLGLSKMLKKCVAAYLSLQTVMAKARETRLNKIISQIRTGGCFKVSRFYHLHCRGKSKFLHLWWTFREQVFLELTRLFTNREFIEWYFRSKELSVAECCFFVCSKVSTGSSRLVPFSACNAFGGCTWSDW